MNINKHYKLFLQCCKMQLMDRFQELFPFIIISFGTLLRLGVTIIFFKAIYLQTNTLGGWDINQMYVLLGTYFFINSISWISYQRGLAKIPRMIENGYLDLVIIRPVNLRIFSIYRYIDLIFSTPQLVVSIGLIIYGGYASVTILNLIYYVFFLITAIILHYSINLLFYSINFYVIIHNTFYIIEETMKLGQYPITIYKGLIKTFLTIIIPVAFIFSIPSQALFGNITIIEVLLAVFLALLFYLLSTSFWEKALNRYESAKG